MSFNISAWSIKKPVPTIVLFLILTIVGWFSFISLGIDTNPNVDIPAVTVTVTQPGAGPAELESQVTKKIEDAVAGLGNIDNMISKVSDGNSTTTINFLLGTNSDRATNDVRNAIAQIRQSLPQDINDPIVQRLDFAGGPIMTYVVKSDRRSVEELSNLTDQTISRALLAVKGVAQIKRVGGVDREIRVNLDPNRLQSLGITATQVNDQIRALNINLPGGRAELGGSEQSIRTLGSAASVDVLKTYEIILPSGGSVPLSSLGTVDDQFGDIRQTASLNNKPVVAFQVLRSTGSVMVTVESGVKAAVKELEKTLPPDVKLDLVFTRADVVRQSYESTIDELIQASILAVIVIMIFLRDWRATLITAVALPLSMIPTFAVQQALGYTLNNMTLLALALAVGNLVDDAVVEIENMERHMAMGKSAMQAAYESSEEVGLAVVASSATIIAVFLPVAFMGGIPGQFFQPFGFTVAISTIFSTLVARMITPMMGAYLLKDKDHTRSKGIQDQNQPRFIRLLNFKFKLPTTSKKTKKLSTQHGLNAPLPLTQLSTLKPRKFQPYKSLLQWALRHKLTTIAIALAFFIASLMLVPMIPKGFVDDGDYGLSSISIEIPPGSTLADMNQVVTQTTNILLKNPHVAQVVATEDLSTATLAVNLKPKEERKISQKQFEEEIRPLFQQIPGARISFQSQVPGDSRKGLSIVLRSENPEALSQAASDLEKQMRTIPGLVEVSSSASLVKPEILVIPDPQRAADLGVTVQAIARTASLATIGDNDANLAKYNLSDRQIPIRVQIDPKARADINNIKNLQVPSQNGSLVPLLAVADIRFGSGPATINRYDRARQVAVEANLQGIALGEAVQTVNKLPIMQNLPPGVMQQPSGGAKIMQDIFRGFGSALGLAILCIYAILVLLYNNFLHPLSIMAALPFCLGGALVALMVMQKPLGLYALIGIVLLLGIVTKNSILLVDYTIINMQEGKSQRQALIEAGVSRLRPIMMTSLATIAGTLPLALGIGVGSEVRQPMGIAIMGGFTTSTLLTLVVVPVIFSYIDNFQNWIMNTLRYGFGKKPPRPASSEHEVISLPSEREKSAS
ncbi:MULTISPECIES: efflux RND transporter permease subunit [unclassified Tolypothrix]|uniref:efflux RND transporter permease subunit n=1 Tax=unclassified Tolypothrix TaxID=2649714 RepID=UPI0005EAC3A9|nr:MULTISPECIES: efflux RND transporter permease subunit [unclassified Tolypothrix]BAY90136.1 acriflavin resistance protein [Microchaete diplosiphon NIES-3275]EKE97353.1 RND transporter, hydrophobe/amphiphile efflux-1 family protein [Tolypothrix sp. PCC 7601]MBE9083017.1 efflux RND transporter permease subunit [Tolypothrix sp. LEGE 11397]UYD24348.1 efflux RND transporter permease subunit [Tolypothrix sp. PCC 7712]UYD33418.1 efflux RND transporter permease subunit [Tolypothrix sp. PCC 7601]